MPSEDSKNTDKILEEKIANEKKHLADLIELMSKIQENNWIAFNRMQAEKLHSREQVENANLTALRNDLLHKILNISPNSTNQYGQSLLAQAFLQQEFELAQALIAQGAKVGPREFSALSFALDTNTALTSGYSSEELGVSINPHELHAVKEFGLTLGIEATAVDGTFSQYAHIGPTFHLLTKELASYANDDPHFAEIAEAHQATDKACAYEFSRANKNAGTELAKRFQEGKITVIPTGCQGHAMAVTLVDNHLVFTNRGVGKDPNASGTMIYEIKDKSLITPEFINKLANGVDRGTSHAEIMGAIASVVRREPVCVIEQKDQKYDNCTVANPRSNLHGVLTVLNKRKTGQLDSSACRDQYKNFTGAMRDKKTDKLILALKQDPNNVDIRTLAHQYIQQHQNRGQNHKDVNRISRLQEALVQYPPKSTIVSHSYKFKPISEANPTPIAAAGAKPKKDNKKKLK